MCVCEERCVCVMREKVSCRALGYEGGGFQTKPFLATPLLFCFDKP